MNWLTEHRAATIGAAGTVIGAIIGGVCTFLFGFWAKPDLRYEEGAYYAVGEISVVSLKLENFGGSDAEKVRVCTRFPKPLAQPPKTSNESDPLIFPVEFAKGHESVVGEVERIVPGQKLWITYAVQGKVHSTPDAKADFVTEISYKGGLAKSGQPFSILRQLVVPILCGAFLGYISGILRDWYRARVERNARADLAKQLVAEAMTPAGRERLEEIIQMLKQAEAARPAAPLQDSPGLPQPPGPVASA